ncbi:MAG: WxL protein peptidoglycan domain-containing protein [Acidimicrobiales bacterium]
MCAAIVTLVSTMGASVVPAGAATNGSWSIYPTTISGQLPRPYFQPILAAGQSYSDSVTVTNQTATPETFNLYAADAHNTPNGGFGLSRRTDPKVGMGAWIQLPESQITLAPSSYEVIPFTIAVPADATPGDHPGGIVIEATQGTTTTHGAVSVTVLQAVAVRVYGRVQGKLVSSMGVTNLSISPKTGFVSLLGGGAASTVTFTVANTGNVRLTSTATVTVSPVFGGSAGNHVIKVPELLPQNSETFKVPFNSTIPFGQLSASVHLSAAGTASSGAASALVIPWLLILIILLVVAALIWRHHRRKMGTQAHAHGPSSSKGRADRATAIASPRTGIGAETQGVGSGAAN